MHDPLMSVIIVVAIAVVIVRRFIGLPLVAKEVFLSPLIFLAIGVWQAGRIEDGRMIDGIVLGVGLVVGLAFGAARGTTTRVFTREGTLHQRYTVWTLVLWVCSLAGGAVLYVVGEQLGAGERAHSTLLSIGVGLLGEMVTSGIRALSTGKPFAAPGDDREPGWLSGAVSRVAVPEEPGELMRSPTLREAIATLAAHHGGGAGRAG